MPDFGATFQTLPVEKNNWCPDFPTCHPHWNNRAASWVRDGAVPTDQLILGLTFCLAERKALALPKWFQQQAKTSVMCQERPCFCPTSEAKEGSVSISMFLLNCFLCWNRQMFFPWLLSTNICLFSLHIHSLSVYHGLPFTLADKM